MSSKARRATFPCLWHEPPDPASSEAKKRICMKSPSSVASTTLALNANLVGSGIMLRSK
jgi:hypothetical protein